MADVRFCCCSKWNFMEAARWWVHHVCRESWSGECSIAVAELTVVSHTSVLGCLDVCIRWCWPTACSCHSGRHCCWCYLRLSWFCPVIINVLFIELHKLMIIIILMPILFLYVSQAELFLLCDTMHSAPCMVSICPDICHICILCGNGYIYPHTFSTSDSPTILFMKYCGKIAMGSSLTGALSAGEVWRNCDFQPSYCFILEAIQDRAIVTVTHLSEWCHFQWHWMTVTQIIRIHSYSTLTMTISIMIQDGRSYSVMLTSTRYIT